MQPQVVQFHARKIKHRSPSLACKNPIGILTEGLHLQRAEHPSSILFSGISIHKCNVLKVNSQLFGTRNRNRTSGLHYRMLWASPCPLTMGGGVSF